MIIFTTAHKQFAYEGFDRFSKAVHKTIEIRKYKTLATHANDDGFIYVHSEYRMIKIMLKDTEYMKSMEDYIKIHITNGKPVLTRMSLKKLIEILPNEPSKRIRRSYIVSVSKVNKRSS